MSPGISRIAWAGYASAVFALLAGPLAAQSQQAVFGSGSPSTPIVGWSVALSADVGVAGAPGPHDSTAGALRVYRRNGSTWALEAVLTKAGALGGDWLGTDVAIDGGVIVGGAWGVSDGDDDEPGVHRGAAVVFRRTGGVPPWTEEALLQPATVLENDRFGGAVDVAGDWVVVGAPGADDVGPESGAVYLFHHSLAGWSEQARLTAYDGGPRQRYGCKVSISGDTIVVGASGSDETAGFAGTVYVYRFDGVTWGLEARLAPTSGARDDRFGSALDLADDLLAVGAPRAAVGGTPKAGTVRLFRRTGATWAEEAVLQAAVPVITDNFGAAVDLGDAQLLVGVPGDDALGAQAGRVDRFVHAGGRWAPVSSVAGSAVDTADEFGHAVALEGAHALVGAPNSRISPETWGHVYMFGGLTGGEP